MVSRGVMLFSSALGCYQECYSWPEKEGMGEWSTIWAGALFIWRNLLNGNMVASGNMLDTRQGYYTEVVDITKIVRIPRLSFRVLFLTREGRDGGMI